MEKFKLFDKVVGTISLEKKERHKAVLEEVSKFKSGVEYHEESDGLQLTVTGTLDQLVEIEKYVASSVVQGVEPSGTSSLESSERSAVPSSGKDCCITEPYMATYMTTFCSQELASIQQLYNVTITWSKDGTQAKIESNNRGGSYIDRHFMEACENFSKLYRVLYKDVLKFTFDVSQDNKEFSKENLEVAICEVPQMIAGLIVAKANDGKSYDMYGTGAALATAQEWIRNQLGITSSNKSSSPRTRSTSSNVLTHETPNKIKVVVYQGDITKENTDIIVNASNEHLDHAGGVSWAIAKAGGPSVQQESDAYVKRYGPLGTGNVAITGSGYLNCKMIVHAVGPQWKILGKQGSIKTLKQVCSNVFNVTRRYGCKSVAMPAISSGIYGVPREVCAQTIFAFIDELDQKFASQPQGPFELRLVNIDADTAKVFGKEFHNWKLKGRKLVRRNSSHNVKKAVDKRAVAAVSADDMSKTPKFRAPLVRNSKLDIALSKNSQQPANPSSSPTSGHTKATLLSITSASSTGSGSSSSTSRNAKVAYVTQKSSTQDGIEQDLHILNNQLVDGDPGMNSNPTSASGQSDLKALAQSTQNASVSHARQGQEPTKQECPICQCTVTDPKVLSKCDHTFCTPCIDKAFSYQKKCPICQKVYGIAEGDQPHGTMTAVLSHGGLPGHEGYHHYLITYNIPSGKQDSRHPNPGQRYHGTARTAYLPATKEGDVVVKLLQKAFEKKLIFTVGRSTTTGRENCVTWNDVHHKTSMTGGPQRFGYPDPDYLRRVKEELKAKGIVPD